MSEGTKRAFDVVVAVVALAGASPLIAVAAIAVKLDSVGPVLFRQKRVGRGRRAIETLKLRTMTASPQAGPQVTSSSDPRITRVGRFLRRTKLDELPQFWNVLRGDMSIVGPRPEVDRYVALYRSEWEPLLSVRPGLTDLASIVFRDEESLLDEARDHERAYEEVIMPMKLGVALLGLSDSSIRSDVLVILRTLLAIVGIRSEDQVRLEREARRRIESLNHVAGDA